jgi:hypothetical protein
LAQPITPAASTAAFTTNPPSTANLPGVREGALPANLVAQLGYVGVLQRDPRAAFDLSIVYSGGDESDVPVPAQPPRVTVPLPTTGLAWEDESDSTVEEQTAAVSVDNQYIPSPILEAPPVGTAAEVESTQIP